MKKVKYGVLIILTMLCIFTIKDVFASEISDNLLKEIVPDGTTLTIKGKSPTTYGDAYSYINNYLNNNFNEDGYNLYGDCNPNELTSCIIEISTNDYKTSWDSTQQKMVVVSGWKETYNITVNYIEPVENVNADNKIEEIKSKINIAVDDITTYFKVEDLSLINYYLTGDKSELWNPKAASRAIKFSDINKIANGANITYDLMVGFGEQGEDLMFEDAGGETILYHDGYIYGSVTGGIHLKRVIYIPNETEDTPEEYVKAAQKRINDYLKNEDVKVSFGGSLTTIADHLTEVDYHILLDPTIDIDDTDGNYYNIKIGNRTYKFYIIKSDNANLEEPTYLGTDINTNIEITSESAMIPLDTSLTVKNVDDESIKNKLGTDNYKSYDIALYSDAKNSKIENLENDKFLVKIPVPEKLNNKELIVYYLKEDETLEKHDVIIKNGYAVFETDHFSIYTLAENVATSSNDEANGTTDTETDTVNPQTGDNIIFYVSMLGLSIVGLIGTSICLKKKLFSNN